MEHDSPFKPSPAVSPADFDQLSQQAPLPPPSGIFCFIKAVLSTLETLCNFPSGSFPDAVWSRHIKTKQNISVRLSVSVCVFPCFCACRQCSSKHITAWLLLCLPPPSPSCKAFLLYLPPASCQSLQYTAPPLPLLQSLGSLPDHV